MLKLVQSAWDDVREAIKNNRNDETLELLEEGLEKLTMQHNSLVSFVGMALNRLANFSEEEIEKLCRERYTYLAQDWIKTTSDGKDSVEKFAGLMGHPCSKVTISEEPDRYVLTLDPCRTGGRLRRGINIGPLQASGLSIGTTKEAHPWSWGKKGVSYYCIHECLFLEIIPIELRGYPIAVVQYAEKAEDPCILYFYKKPDLIPEEYFTRVGKIKTIK